ncbi:retrovirus-related pol polyprotein from transposon TNT 1-94 [Tanacetum coccineum]
MQIPDWMITEDMKHTEHYRMYAEVFGLDVPLTRSLPTESTQGTHRTPSAPRSPTHKTDSAESSAPKRSTVIRFCLPERRSTRLTPPAPVPTVEKADEMILQDTLQHLASEEIEKMVEGSENVIDDSLPPRNDEPHILDTRLEPKSDKEKEDEITDEVYELKRRKKGKIVEESRSIPFPTPIRSPRTHTNLVSSNTEKLQELTVTHTQTTSSSRSQHTNLSRANRLLSLFKAKPARFNRYKNFFQELQGRYTYLFKHLKQRFLSRKSFDTLADHLQEVMVESLPIMVDTHIKEQVKKKVPEQVRDQVPVYLVEGLILERQNTKKEMERMIAKAILQERGNIQAEISSQIQKAIDNQIPSQVDASVRSYMSEHILHVYPAQTQTLFVHEQQYQLYLSMKNDLQLQQQDIAIWLALQMKFENLQVQQTTCRPSAVRPRDQDDPHDDAHPEGENSAKRHKTSEYEAYVSGESSSGQVNEEERGPSTLGNQEQEDDYDFWTDSYASDDDEVPSKQVSQDIMEEVSMTIDEAKLKKMADEMLRQRCTSRDEHQYHIDQMKNFLKSDIVWETLALSLINQDLLYLKKGSSGTEKIVLSLHKFLTIIFNDDDIEERTSRWVNKCVKKFNPYARYGVEHWKNPHAKIFYIRKQKEPGKPKEEVYSNSKIIQVIKTYWELGHEHKFITEIVASRANECIVSITEPDYKNLNKNDIKDMYLLIMNGKVPDYAETGLLCYQQKVNLTAPSISFLGVEKHKMFSIIYEPVHGIIYKNSKKEKRVMRHSEIHKFCDATLNRVLEGLKSYNNDVKYGYVQRELANDEVEYLKLFTILYYPRSGSLPVSASLGTMAGVDVDTLTMEQYLALSQENQAPGVVKPEIGGNVNFKIKITKDAVMLRVFPFTLTRAAKRWVDRLAPGTINTWDLLKKAFIQRYCPPSLTSKQLEVIHNFKQEGDESLYQAWERYNDLLYKSPTHDINSHQKVNIFYKGLSIMNRQLVDSQGPIPGMRPAKALTSIQTMADHSQKWHDGTTSRNIGSNCSKDGLVALVNKLDNLGRDMKKLKESVHAIQVGCQIYEGTHLDKDCPLNEEVKQVEEVRYGEFGRTMPFNGSNGGKFHVGPPGYYTKIDNRPPYAKKRQSLEELLAKHQEESARRSTEMELTKEIRSDKTLDSSSEQIKTITADQETSGLNKLHGVSFISDPESDATEVLQHQLPRKELNPGNFTLPCTIGKFNFYAMADLGASINVMPRSIFEHLHLTNLRKTNMLCEMADMSKKAPLGIVEKETYS